MPIRLPLRQCPLLFTALTLLALGLTSACGGGGASSPAQPSITRFTATPELITQGNSAVLSASYANGTGSVDPSGAALGNGGSLTVTPAASQTYTLTVTGAAGSTTRSVQVQVVAPPVLPVVQAPRYAATLVEGYTAAVPAQARCNYAWTLNGGSITAGAGTPQVTFTAGSPGTASLICVVTNEAGTAAASSPAEVAVLATPAAPALSAPGFCTLGLSAVVSATVAQDCTPQWSVTSGTLLPGQSAGSVQVSSSNLGDTTVTVRALNLAGALSAPVSKTISFVPIPSQPLVQAPSHATAQVAGYTASVPTQPHCTCAWTVDGGLLTAGAGTPQITFTAGNPGTAKLTCVVNNGAGSASTAGRMEVTVVAAPDSPTLSAPAFATLGVAVTATATTRQDCSLLWSFSAGSIRAGQPAMQKAPARCPVWPA